MNTLVPALVAIFVGGVTSADELVDTRSAKAPDGRKELVAKVWAAEGNPRIEVVLTEGAKRLFTVTIPPEKEPRYAKLSWAPSSSAALVAVNFKAAEDWIFIRLADGKASSTYFDGDELVTRKMLDVLPFREEIKNIAPVCRVPWPTVHWIDGSKVALTFISRGVGREGNAHLRIDYSRKEPVLRVVSISPTVDAELWKQD